jgi:hypothetical protein
VKRDDRSSNPDDEHTGVFRFFMVVLVAMVLVALALGLQNARKAVKQSERERSQKTAVSAALVIVL